MKEDVQGARASQGVPPGKKEEQELGQDLYLDWRICSCSFIPRSRKADSSRFFTCRRNIVINDINPRLRAGLTRSEASNLTPGVLFISRAAKPNRDFS